MSPLFCHILLCLIILNLLWLINAQHKNDLCAIGRSGNNGGILNSNFTYMGLDANNSNKPYWFSECYDVAIEWGGGYCCWGNRYVLKSKHVVGYYGMCGLLNTNPFDCDGYWQIWDGSAYTTDPIFTIRNCSYYTNQNDSQCNDETYLLSMGLQAPALETYCVSNSTLRTDINGVYEYKGCDLGLPYYKHTDATLYIHFDWCYGYWAIGYDYTSIILISYCYSYDFQNCDGNLQEWVDSSWQLDDGAVISADTCSAGTTSLGPPNTTVGMAPTVSQTQPSFPNSTNMSIAMSTYTVTDSDTNITSYSSSMIDIDGTS